MADFDIYNDTLPDNPNTRQVKPTIDELKTAIAESENGDSYDLSAATRNDLISIARVEGITVETTL